MGVLAREIPEPLHDLVDLALDLRWTWSHEADALWKDLEPETWERTENPWVILQTVSRDRLQAAAEDGAFTDRLNELAETRKRYLGTDGWYRSAYGDEAMRRVAYFSLEFGLGEALPLYAGGLGILAGDYLKACSDLGVPVVGVGLLYREGYFRQMVDAEGRQQELYPHNDPSVLPIEQVMTESGAPLRVRIGLPGRELVLQVWRARVGRVELILLDSSDPLNTPADQGITTQLYGGDAEVRLMQEIVLGVGGWRALGLLGIQPEVCHLNEGHPALAVLARARDFAEEADVSFQEALWATRAGNVLTTHTPVAAAFDTYPPELAGKWLSHLVNCGSDSGVSREALLQLGRARNGDPDEPFNMTYLAMRGCGYVNAVSRLHRDVSRDLFQGLYPRWPTHEIPVDAITNGVHMPSWDSPWADRVWEEAGGKDRWRGSVEDVLGAVDEMENQRLWSFRCEERANLVHYARSRLKRQLMQRGSGPGQMRAAEEALDPDALLLGFARRFTAYKRPNLLLTDPDRLAALLTDDERPLQIVLAGKAHPRDEEGKALIQAWVRFADGPDLRRRVVFLEDYDMALAQELVQGVDVWLNTPRRPWEACGTSGMKVLVNGGLNLSELDGWWAEAYNESVGWAIGDGAVREPAEANRRDAEELYRVLEERVIPCFYDRNEDGIPEAWICKVRDSMSSLAPRFSCNRMARDYIERAYMSAAGDFRARSADGARQARGLAEWGARVRQHWHGVRIARVEWERQDDAWLFSATVYTGALSLQDLVVELYADPPDEGEPAFCRAMDLEGEAEGDPEPAQLLARAPQSRPVEDFTVRVRPACDGARLPAELPLIKWHR